MTKHRSDLESRENEDGSRTTGKQYKYVDVQKKNEKPFKSERNVVEIRNEYYFVKLLYGSIQKV